MPGYNSRHIWCFTIQDVLNVSPQVHLSKFYILEGSSTASFQDGALKLLKVHNSLEVNSYHSEAALYLDHLQIWEEEDYFVESLTQKVKKADIPFLDPYSYVTYVTFVLSIRYSQ